MHCFRRACLTLIFFATPLQAATYYVRPAGNDQSNGTTPAAAFATVIRAAQLAGNGDEIIIAPGSYAGGLVLENGRAPMSIALRSREMNRGN